MNGHETDDRTPEERAAFDALPRERAPSPLLEERTVRALRSRELLRRSGRQPGRRPWMAAAAAIALFAGGFAAGWTSRREPAGPVQVAERPAAVETAEPGADAREARRILWL